jgi:hypothetical protein
MRQRGTVRSAHTYMCSCGTGVVNRCSNQLDPDRLAADVPKNHSRSSLTSQKIGLGAFENQMQYLIQNCARGTNEEGGNHSRIKKIILNSRSFSPSSFVYDVQEMYFINVYMLKEVKMILIPFHQCSHPILPAFVRIKSTQKRSQLLQPTHPATHPMRSAHPSRNTNCAVLGFRR